MKIFLIILFLLSPLKKIDTLNIQINTNQFGIFTNYSNDNFKQDIIVKGNSVKIKTESLNYLRLNLNFRVFPDTIYINSLSEELQNAINTILKGVYNLEDYMVNVSKYLKTNIKYSVVKMPQDATTVIINKKAHCVGFSNLTSVFLRAIGISSHFSQGFYLKKKKGKIVPIPHKWLEIELENGYLYFYDPQYQKFSSNYIVVKNSVNFKNIRKFKIKLLKYSKNIIN